jgi:hypothetical protein
MQNMPNAATGFRKAAKNVVALQKDCEKLAKTCRRCKKLAKSPQKHTSPAKGMRKGCATQKERKMRKACNSVPAPQKMRKARKNTPTLQKACKKASKNTPTLCTLYRITLQRTACSVQKTSKGMQQHVYASANIVTISCPRPEFNL